MKKFLRTAFCYWPLILMSCNHSVDIALAYNVAGLYQLIEYSNSNTVDDFPSGAISATQVDNQHVNIFAKGTSGKLKLNYSYTNVLVAEVGPNAYMLLYKGKAIGTAGNDGVSRYLILTPTSIIQLQSEEF